MKRNQQRKWKRGRRRYDFGSQDAQAIIFGAQGAQLWAWAVWGHKFCAEGVEFSLKSARIKANAQLDRLRNGWTTQSEEQAERTA